MSRHDRERDMKLPIGGDARCGGAVWTHGLWRRSAIGLIAAAIASQAAPGQSPPANDRSAGARLDARPVAAPRVKRSANEFNFWLNPQGGFFQDPQNWSKGVPNPTDIVIFDLNTAGYKVEFVEDAASFNLLALMDTVELSLNGLIYAIGQSSQNFLQVGNANGGRGLLTITDGVVTVTGSIVILAGQLRIGHDGLLIANGGLTMPSTSGIAIQLDEDSPATQGVPPMQLGGLAQLDGVLVLTLGANSDPATGTVFTVIGSEAISGTFGVIITPPFPGTDPLRFLNMVGPGILRPTGDGPARLLGGFPDTVDSVVEELPLDLEFEEPSSDIIVGDPTGAAVADFDGVNGADAVIALDGTPGAIQVLFNDGSGQAFTAGPALTAGNSPSAVAIFDLGDPDGPGVVVANEASNNIMLFLNDGSGNLALAQTVNVGAQPAALAVGDLTGDGTPDIAVANRGSNTVTLIQSDTGSLTVYGTLGTHTGPRGLAMAHFDSDGLLDLAVANEIGGTIQFFRNGGGGAMTFDTSVLVSGGPGLMDPEDLDNDKDTDVVVVNEDSGRVTIVRNESGGGSAGPLVFSFVPTGFPAGDRPTSVDVGDFDGDGDKDLAIVHGVDGSRAIRIYRNDSPTLSSTAPLVYAIDSDRALDDDRLLGLIARLNGDVLNDLVAVSRAPTGLGALRASGQIADVSFLLNSSGPPCPADIVGNGSVDVTDLLSMLAAWGPCMACPQDIDGNGQVDVNDLLALLAAWGACP